nr:MAG TPA: hypothetical protein [Caudoviricetes sp.]
MNFLNIKNIHDNSLAQFKVGLVKSTTFKVKNDGNTISIEDDANSVTKLKVGGSAGFTISLVGDHIVFSANSGASPLCVSEPGKGGIPGCSYYYCHLDKYGGGGTRSSVRAKSAPTTLSLTDQSQVEDDTKNFIPNPNSVPEGSLLIAKNGKWTPISMGELVSQITQNVISQLSSNTN